MYIKTLVMLMLSVLAAIVGYLYYLELKGMAALDHDIPVQKTVLMCHYTYPGETESVTIEVDERSIKPLLYRGDKMGRCPIK